jgi:4-hydroxythreonine-4-phosphate dehydrogenase
LTPTEIVISMGDPVGIGPEVVLKCAEALRSEHRIRLVVVGDEGVLSDAADQTGLGAVLAGAERLPTVDAPASRPFAVFSASHLPREARQPGVPNPGSDRAQVDYILQALARVRNGPGMALVTAPIHKEAMHRAGFPYSGHTGLLGHELGVETPVMMLASDSLRVVPLSQHIALADVPKRVTRLAIGHAVRVLVHDLRVFFEIPHPRIAVAGLNPHAGEQGLFGTEEQAIIRPAVEALRAEGYDVAGPISPDVVYRQAYTGDYDAVVGMYHDQALIPIKMVAFERAVNVTLGLPIVRTSVDHGTAYDIAGQGLASANSLAYAVDCARSMIQSERSRSVKAVP